MSIYYIQCIIGLYSVLFISSFNRLRIAYIAPRAGYKGQPAAQNWYELPLDPFTRARSSNSSNCLNKFKGKVVTISDDLTFEV